MPRKAGKAKGKRTRLPNPRLVKIHRSYTVEEVAKLYGNHKGTVRQWIKRGLPTCHEMRPTLILGHALMAFLTQRRAANKRPCAPGELYCLRCRVPQTPAGAVAKYEAVTPSNGNLIGTCPVCALKMFRRVSLLRLKLVSGPLTVAMPLPAPVLQLPPLAAAPENADSLAPTVMVRTATSGTPPVAPKTRAKPRNHPPLSQLGLFGDE